MTDFIKQHWDKMILIVVVVFVLYSLVNGYLSCDGTYVRGLFWMECIE